MRWREGFRRDEDGSVLAEFALVLPLFLVLLMAAIDFGQIYLRWILAEKATSLAARIAVVRPPLCQGVPIFNDRTPGIPKTSPFGTTCTASFFDLCEDPGTVSCTGDDAVGTSFDDLFDTVSRLLPATIQPENLRFTYSFANLGFLGGPYVPLVSVELVGDVEVPFITPLGPLLEAFYGGGGLDDPSLPPMRATLPAEDLLEGGPG
jgi:Flp pilus assembly protein TadG